MSVNDEASHRYQRTIVIPWRACESPRVVTHIKTYSSELEAEFARVMLRAEGIAATVVGVSLAMEGGTGGVRLFVPDEQIDAARDILGET